MLHSCLRLPKYGRSWAAVNCERTGKCMPLTRMWSICSLAKALFRSVLCTQLVRYSWCNDNVAVPNSLTQLSLRVHSGCVQPRRQLSATNSTGALNNLVLSAPDEIGFCCTAIGKSIPHVKLLNSVCGRQLLAATLLD